MMALEAKIHIKNTQGDREVAFKDFYLLPGSTPEKETVLKPGELITAVELLLPAGGTKSYYLKLRDRASYEFALASAAVVVTVKNNRFEKEFALLWAGIGAIPWRMEEGRKSLEGQAASAENFKRAARSRFERTRNLRA